MSGVKDLVPTWGSSRPWLGTREQIAAGQFPGISVGSPRGTELASYQGGQVVVKDSWFAQPEGARRAILYHEAGHGLADAALLGTARHGLDSPLDLLGWPKASWLGHNYDEIVAEAYSVIWTEPQWFDDDDKRAVRDLVIALAREHGYPLPPSVRTASGTLTAGASAMSLVYRGLPLFIDSEQDARSLLSGGGAAAAVLLRLVADDGLGVWWTSSAGEAYSHAETTSGDYDLSVEGAVAAADRGEGYYGAETPVVLTANAPTVWEDDDWRVAEGSDIDLVSVKYSTNPMDDTAWIEVPVGRRLTASAAGLPSGIRFEHIPHYQQGLDGLSASLGGGEVGLLLWQRPRSSPWDGEIYSAWVDEDYRRQGIATEMLARAREIEPTVHHSDTLSDEGRAWAEKVGSYSERRGTKIGTYKEFDLHHENHGSTENIWAYLTNDLRGPGWEKYAVGNLRWWNDQGPSYGVAPGMIEWVEVKDPHKHKGLASEMLRLAREIQPNVHHSTNLTPAGTGWSQRVGSVPGVVFEHEESRSEYGGTVTTDPRMVAYDGEREVGALDWDARDPRLFGTVKVDPAYRGRGIATRLYEEAKAVNPDLDPETSVFFTPAGRGWVDSLNKTARADADGFWYHFGISLQRDVEGQYVHLGTARAARDRMNNTRQEGRRPDGTFYRAKIHPRNPLGSLSSPLTDAEVNILLHWEGTAQRPGEMPSEENDGHEPPWFYPANSPTPMDIAARLPYRGAWMHDAYFYTNTVEDPGSVSVAIDPDVITEDDIAPPFNESVGPGQLLLWGSRGPMATWEDMDQARPGPGQHLPEVGTPHVASRTDMLDPRDNLRSTMPAKTAVLDVCPECGSSDVSIVDYSDNLHECGACTAMWDSTTVWGSRSDYEHWLHEGRRLAARKTATAFESLSDEGRGWARGMDDAELRDEWDAALRLQDRFPDQTDPVDEILPLAEEAQRRGIALPGWNPTDPRFAPRAPEFDPDEGRVPREDPDDRRERMRWGSRKTPLVMGKTQRVASTERDLGDGWKATREGDQGRSKANRVWRVTHDGEYQGIVETLTQARHMKDRGPRNTSALRSLALGETVVPAEVDTLRDSACPVCGTADYRGTRCNSCGYVKPPVIFDDPNVEKAKEVDSHAPREVVDLACDHCGTGFPAESLSTTAARKDDDEDEDDIPYPDEDDEEDEDSAEDAYPDDEGVQDLDDDDADGDADDDGEDPDDEEEGDVPEVVQEDPGSDDEGDEDTDIQPDDEDDESSDDVEEAIDEARDDDGEVDPEDEGEPAEETGTEDGLDLSVGDICPDCGVGTLLPKDEIDGVESSQNLPSDPEGQQERMDGPTDGPDQKESMMSTTSRGETRNPRSETFTGASNPVQQRLAAQNRAHRAQMRAMEERTGRQIGVLAQQNEMLRSAVASLAEEMGPAGRRVAASLGVRLAESDAPTNDADAAAPEATDDVESPGKAPDAVNDDITADGTTDVESTDVVLAETELTDLENVLEETPQVQSEDKTVHHREPQPSADGRAEQANRIEDSGWTTASKEDGGKEGQWASLRVAQLRIKAGVETEDEIVLAQRIATQMTVEQMQVEANALERVLAASKGKPAPRNLVPQSTGGGTPSLARRSTASTDDADEGVPDVSDSFGV